MRGPGSKSRLGMYLNFKGLQIFLPQELNIHIVDYTERTKCIGEFHRRFIGTAGKGDAPEVYTAAIEYLI